MDGLEQLKHMFSEPGAEYRSLPFWAWNDKLSVQELVWQIKEMKDQGVGGFFMHSREGLETGYMEEEWLECTRAAVEASKENGLSAWLYDEDRFPSGGAGGIVAKIGGDSFRAKALSLEVASGEFVWSNDVLAAYHAVLDEGDIISCRLLPYGDGIEISGDDVLLIIRRELADPSEWFNNEAPTDNLNPECVAAFIESTHEKYKALIGGEFGNTIPGIFTDEPANVDFRAVFPLGRPWIPWTDGFDSYFLSKRGYSILEALPFVFLYGEKSNKARHDYWRTITERFCESFSWQIGDWCEHKKLKYTGHYLGEHSLCYSTLVNGATMPHYRYQHIPGIDLLGENTEEYLTVKQCTSVAHQYGRKKVVAEMYGCTGWDFTFEGQKWVGDWLFVMGVNVRCQHLSLYSLRGCRKRDFPPSFNYNSCWWKYNHVVEDYFARIALIMGGGQAVRDILVIHPASTVWSMTGAYMLNYQTTGNCGSSEMDAFEERYNRFIKLLLGIHYDFDFGDEMILSESGKVESGKICVNHAKYPVIVLYGMRTFLKSTDTLLGEFLDAGGIIISVGPLVNMLEGDSSKATGDIYSHNNMIKLDDESELEAVLQKIIPRRVSIKNSFLQEAPQFLYNLKQQDNLYTLFIVNNDRNNAQEVDIMVDAFGSVEEWDPLAGSIDEIAVSQIKDGLKFHACFGPAASRLYTINMLMEPKSSASNNSTASCLKTVYKTLAPSCRFTRTSPNALLLDECTFRISQSKPSEKMYVWQAQEKIRNVLDMKDIKYNGLPQRYMWVDEPHPNDGKHVDFMFEFYVETVPVNDTFLVVENVKHFSIGLNGLSIPNDTVGWYMDKSFDKIKLYGLRQGINKLVLSCGYMNNMEVEDCFIVGDFGVDTERRIVGEPERLHFGDWCLQGYFHYSGSMVYHFDLDIQKASKEKYILELGDYRAVDVEIRLNGVTSGHVPWKSANRVDLTSFIKNGANRLEIEVMGSQVNLFGPFHRVGTNNPWTDWTLFSREGSRNTPGYAVKPYGLMDQVNIYKE